MGGSGSKPSPPPSPPPTPFYDEPWRDMDWGQRQADLDYVKNFRPQDEAQQIRVLLHGPVAAGKSSFISSVHSVLHGRVCRQALEANTSGSSFTKEYRTFKIPKGTSGGFYPFVFTDIMGLEPHGGGVHVDDIKLALKGHVKDGYKFNPTSRLSEGDQFYNQDPTANDKVHVLVCVIDADTVSRIKDETLKKIRDIREEASRLNIVQMIMITEIDQLCPEMENLRNVYKSKLLKQKMEQISADVGIPMNCIFPVKNYHEEIQPNTEADSLILSALKNIIDAGNDCVIYNTFNQVLRRPWTEIDRRQRQDDLDYVKKFRPDDEAQQIRVLLHGPAGAGKSSFINSVHSVLRGRLYRQALEDTTGGRSFTREYRTYKIPNGTPCAFYPFVFTDIMGLDTHGGVHVEDIKLALKGHVKEDYKFNPTSRLSEGDQFYNQDPTANDKVHVLVCVIPADAVSRMKDETLKKIRDIRKEASRLNIVQMIMITKIDQLCPEMKDLRNVYKSKLLKEKMEKISVDVGIPMNCIFPVKSYHEEIQLNDDADSLILSALRNIIDAGNDCVNYNRV